MIFNLNQYKYVALHPVWPERVTERMRGMIGRSFNPSMDAMVFVNCSAIHTVGMKFPLDVIFVDSRGKVLMARAAVKPGKMLVACRGADKVIELPPGVIAASGTEKGDILNLEMNLTAEALEEASKRLHEMENCAAGVFSCGACGDTIGCSGGGKKTV